jgi:hypothetical protein
VLDPNVRPVNKGIKAAAWKFVQKVLICGTRVTSADPRVSPAETMRREHVTDNSCNGEEAREAAAMTFTSV